MKLWIFSIGILIGCGGKQPLDPYPLFVQASELVEAYKANELAADERFKGKTLRIKGVVREVSKDILGDPFVILGASQKGYLGVQCSFASSTAPILSRLIKGETASFDCRVSGKLVHVQASGCAVNLMP